MEVADDLWLWKLWKRVSRMKFMLMFHVIFLRKLFKKRLCRGLGLPLTFVGTSQHVISIVVSFSVLHISKEIWMFFNTEIQQDHLERVRPNTSRRQWRRLPPCTLVIALVPLTCSSRNLQFSHRVPFTKEKLPWCPCPFKNEAYRPEKFWMVLGCFT